jgi:hypothetical protein
VFKVASAGTSAVWLPYRQSFAQSTWHPRRGSVSEGVKSPQPPTSPHIKKVFIANTLVIVLYQY